MSIKLAFYHHIFSKLKQSAKTDEPKLVTAHAKLVFNFYCPETTRVRVTYPPEDNCR